MAWNCRLSRFRLVPLYVLFLMVIESSAAEIKIVSFNVNLHNVALEETLGLIGKQGADVILIQESTEKFEKAAKKYLPSRYKHSWFTGEDPKSGGGFAVISRFPLEEKEFIKKTTGMFGAQKLGVRVGEVTVQFVNIHLNPAGLPRPYDEC